MSAVSCRIRSVVCAYTLSVVLADVSKKKKSKKPLRRFLKDAAVALAVMDGIIRAFNDALDAIAKLLDLLKG